MPPTNRHIRRLKTFKCIRARVGRGVGRSETNRIVRDESPSQFIRVRSGDDDHVRPATGFPGLEAEFQPHGSDPINHELGIPEREI